MTEPAALQEKISLKKNDAPHMAFSQPASAMVWLSLLGVVTVLILALVIKLCGQNPVIALRELWAGSFGSVAGVASSAARAAILVFFALGISISFRAGILNIGAEGQARMGAAAATALAISGVGSGLSQLPALGISVLLLTGALFGAILSLIAGILRQWRGVPEVISTLMMNYTAIQIVHLLVTNPALLRGKSILPQSDPFPAGLQFPGWSGTEFHSGALLAVPAVLVFHLFLFSTISGFGLRAMGLNPVAAETNGVPVKKLALQSFVIAGGMAGFAGALGVLALGRLSYESTYPDYGFMAIAVALVADLKPLYVLPSSLFFAGLEAGAKSMQGNAHVPYWVVYLIEGLVILAILVRGVQVFSKKNVGESS